MRNRMKLSREELSNYAKQRFEDLNEALGAAQGLTAIQAQIACDEEDKTLPTWWTGYHSGAINMALASAIKYAEGLSFRLEGEIDKAEGEL